MRVPPPAWSWFAECVTSLTSVSTRILMPRYRRGLSHLHNLDITGTAAGQYDRGIIFKARRRLECFNFYAAKAYLHADGAVIPAMSSGADRACALAARYTNVGRK